MRPPSCLQCGVAVAAITATVDPKTVAVALKAQCGHVVDNEMGRDLWRLGYRWTVPAVSGASLVMAERARHLVEEGFTPEHDLQHTDGLPWAAWCYLDRAMNPTDDEGPPQAWPWEDEAWNAHASVVRRLIIAGALVVAEIDRRLMLQRGPT